MVDTQISRKEVIARWVVRSLPLNLQWSSSTEPVCCLQKGDAVQPRQMKLWFEATVLVGVDEAIPVSIVDIDHLWRPAAQRHTDVLVAEHGEPGDYLRDLRPQRRHGPRERTATFCRRRATLQLLGPAQ